MKKGVDDCVAVSNRGGGGRDAEMARQKKKCGGKKMLELYKLNCAERRGARPPFLFFLLERGGVRPIRVVEHIRVVAEGL